MHRIKKKIVYLLAKKVHLYDMKIQKKEANRNKVFLTVPPTSVGSRPEKPEARTLAIKPDKPEPKKLG